MKRLRWEDLDHDTARRMIASAERKKTQDLSQDDLIRNLLARGLIWNDPDSAGHFATAAGIVLLARDPSAVFPHCRILADAYRGIEADGDPADHTDIRDAMPLAIEKALAFIDRNTRHPIRVVGLNRVRLDEYPPEALREALVNAVAHRDYEDGSRKIMLEVFSDRVVVSSRACRLLQSHCKSSVPENTAHVPATRSLRNAFHSFTASRSAAAVSGGCAIR
jgi:predicted HTH transcriptional regulator